MLSILILNWNGRRFLGPCLASLHRHILVPFEVILVDNASTDASPDFLAESYPWVKLIRSPDNLGFARGNNLAARQAAFPYLLLLNNDTLLHTGLTEAIQALKDDPRIGALGATMLAANGSPRPACGRFPTPLRLWRFANLWSFRARLYPSPAAVPLLRCDMVEGSFLLTRAALWQQLGGMDERNYMYGDDVEYCRSLAILGFATVLCPSVRYTHFGGYDHARMAYLYAGFRRYHRKFSSRRVQLAADLVLRTGLLARLPWYWLRAQIKRDEPSRSALKYAIALNQNWAQTLRDAHRYH